MVQRIVRMQLINSQSKLERNFLKTILKINRVKEQIHMEGSPRLCNVK